MNPKLVILYNRYSLWLKHTKQYVMVGRFKWVDCWLNSCRKQYNEKKCDSVLKVINIENSLVDNYLPNNFWETCQPIFYTKSRVYTSVLWKIEELLIQSLINMK